MALPLAAGALRVGSSILRKAKIFKRGIDATADVGRGTVKKTISKIQSTNKKIKTEKKKQARFDTQIQEEVSRRAKESGLEKKRLTKKSGGLLEKVIKRPLAALLKLLAAWVVDNLPRIIEFVENTTKRIRIFVAAIKNSFMKIGSIIASLGRIIVAYAKNIKELDFNDTSGRIKKANEELGQNVEDLNTSFAELKNVWGREGKELDKVLESLENGESLDIALKAVDKEFAVDVAPQTPAVGPGSRSAGTPGTNKWGMSTSAVTNTKWTPLLNLIASAEAKDGSYDSAYPSKIIPGLSGMSIADAIEKSGGKDSTGKHYAIGRYQFTRADEQAAAVGLKPTDPFSPVNQDKMAIGLITKKRKISADTLKNDPYKAQMELSKEWAGLAAPDTQKSFYDGDGVNHSSRTTNQIRTSFSEVLAPQVQQQQQPAPAAAPNTQQQGGADNRGMTLGSRLTSKDFNTMDKSVPSPIVKTSGFGPRGGRIHRGIDFAPPNGARGWYCGLNVNGKVSFVGTGSGYGNFVIVQVGNVDLLFGHLNQVSPGIRVGAKYTAGQPIGEVGSTGRSSGTHLHFEARPVGGAGGSGFNPEPYVKYLIFGKLTKQTKAQKVALTGNSGAKAEQLASAAASNRTGAGAKQQDVAIIIATQPIIT